MTQFEAYYFLFTDSFFSNLAITARLELALYTMQILGDYDTNTIFMVALLGATCSIPANYIIGIVCYNLYKFSTDQRIQLRYQKTTTLFKKYGTYILLFAAIPYVGKFAIIIAGFTRFGLMQTLLYATLGRILYYAYVLYL